MTWVKMNSSWNCISYRWPPPNRHSPWDLETKSQLFPAYSSNLELRRWWPHACNKKKNIKLLLKRNQFGSCVFQQNRSWNWISDLECCTVEQSFSNLANINTSELPPIMTPVVALHDKLVGSCDEFKTIGMIEPQRSSNFKRCQRKQFCETFCFHTVAGRNP